MSGLRASGDSMGIQRLCRSDPLLSFIRETYGATPLRTPDPRWSPFALFAHADDRIAYLGNLTELPGTDLLPSPMRDSLPKASLRRSAKLTWESSLDVTGPFMSALLGLPLLDLAPSLKVKRNSGATVQISLGRCYRRWVSVIALSDWLEAHEVRLPRVLETPGTIYLANEVYYARELVISVEGVSAAEFASQLRSDLAGEVAGDLIKERSDAICIQGTGPTAFAIGCAEVLLDENKTMVRLQTTTALRAAATEVVGVYDYVQPVLGEDADLIDFDG
jgi:hypothetical protein